MSRARTATRLSTAIDPTKVGVWAGLLPNHILRIVRATANAPPISSTAPKTTGAKPQHDFSKDERGKFCPPEAELRLPIYLSREVQAYLILRAIEKAFRCGIW